MFRSIFVAALLCVCLTACVDEVSDAERTARDIQYIQDQMKRVDALNAAYAEEAARRLEEQALAAPSDNP